MNIKIFSNANKPTKRIEPYKSRLRMNQTSSVWWFLKESLSLAGKNIWVSAMTVQQRLKRALATLKNRLKSDQSVWFEVLFICFSKVSIAAFKAESCRSTPSRHIESMACLRCWCWRFIPSISVDGLQQNGGSIEIQKLIKLDWFSSLMWPLWRIGGCCCWH